MKNCNDLFSLGLRASVCVCVLIVFDIYHAFRVLLMMMMRASGEGRAEIAPSDE